MSILEGIASSDRCVEQRAKANRARDAGRYVAGNCSCRKRRQCGYGICLARGEESSMVLPARRLATGLDGLPHEYKVGARFMSVNFRLPGPTRYRRR